MAAHRFVFRRRIEFFETDMAGIMHFSNFFRLMEQCEHAFLRSLGTSVHPRHAPGEPPTGWPRVHAACRFARPLRFEDEVEVELLIAQIRSSAVRYQFVFRCEGTEAARGEVTAVHVRLDANTGGMKACPIPESLRTQMELAPAELIQSLGA